jgi:predicted nucleic acid-binding protein
MAEQRVVIADAGPLIAVSRVGVLHLLPSMFGEVWITDAVRKEVCDAGAFPGQDLILAALSVGGIALCGGGYDALAAAFCRDRSR